MEENKIHVFFEKEEAFLEVMTESIMNVFVPYETKGHRSKANEGAQNQQESAHAYPDAGQQADHHTRELGQRAEHRQHPQKGSGGGVPHQLEKFLRRIGDGKRH